MPVLALLQAAGQLPVLSARAGTLPPLERGMEQQPGQVLGAMFLACLFLQAL